MALITSDCAPFRFGFWSTILVGAGGCCVLFFLVRPILCDCSLFGGPCDCTPPPLAP